MKRLLFLSLLLASTVVNALPVYDRDYFGHGWSDADRDCQNTRHEVLINQSQDYVKFNTNKSCIVDTGRWYSLYTGEVHFKAKNLDVDHIVPLKFAWEHGAYNWSQEKRELFANLYHNLVPVEASLNRQKGAKGLSEWLPPENKCEYIIRFMRVVNEFELKLSAKESIDYRMIHNQYCS